MKKLPTQPTWFIRWGASSQFEFWVDLTSWLIGFQGGRNLHEIHLGPLSFAWFSRD